MDNDQARQQKPPIAGKHSGTKPRRRPGRQTASGTELRNAELLDKALDLFLEKGFERTTIDGISAAVGMAKRTVYLRYGDKEGLFKASLQRAIEEWIVPIERLQAAETDSVEDTLLRIGQILVANILSPAGLRLMRITNAESGRMPEIGAFTNKQGTEPTIAYLTELIRRRVQPGGVDVPHPEEAAMAFLYLVVGGPASMTAWGIVLDDAAVDRHTRYCVQLFLHGLFHLQQAISPSNPNSVRKKAAQLHQPVPAIPEAHKLKALEDENRQLKILLAESILAATRNTRPQSA
jgi:TetR/AcrR family transcriptional repressor of mexJK operon